MSKLNKSIVAELNRRGLASVAVQIHPDDIDPQTGEDKREAKQGGLLLPRGHGSECLSGAEEDLVDVIAQHTHVAYRTSVRS